MSYSTVLERLVEKDERFDEYHFEGDVHRGGNGHWLYLADGWYAKSFDTHALHEERAKEVLDLIKEGEVVKCPGTQHCDCGAINNGYILIQKENVDDEALPSVPNDDDQEFLLQYDWEICRAEGE